MRRIAEWVVVCAVGGWACTSDEELGKTTGVEGQDLDGDGFSADDDCDDTNPDIRPDAIEACDGIDNNCNALIDDADATLDVSTASAFYIDADGDGYGIATNTQRACTAPDGFSALNSDCLDSDPLVSPEGVEVCNGVDDDCDGLVDDADDSVDTTTGVSAFVDADGDGHGNPDMPVRVCTPADGVVLSDDDCDDTTAERAPDLAEICGDGIDNVCSGDGEGCGTHIRGSTADAHATITSGTQIGLGLAVRLLVHDQNLDGNDDLVVFANGLFDPELGVQTSRRYVAHGPITPGTTDIDDHLEDPQRWIDDDLANALELANVGDLDGDGWDDLVYSSGESLTFESGGTADRVDLDISWLHTIHPVGDLDGDGKAELLVGDQRFLIDGHGQGALALIQGSATVFADLAETETLTTGHTLVVGTAYGAGWSTQQVSSPSSVASLDWDADGLRDLAVGAWGTGPDTTSAIRLVRDAASLPIEQLTYDQLSDEYWLGLDAYNFINQELVTGDLNHDGYDDLIATETVVGGTIYVMFGGIASVVSGTAWDRRDVLITGSEAGGEGQIGRKVAVADLDEDGDLDLIATDPIAPPSSADAIVGFLNLDTTATMGHEDADVRIDSAAPSGQCSSVRPIWRDLSGDDAPDLLLGCAAEPTGGQAHIFFGNDH